MASRLSLLPLPPAAFELSLISFGFLSDAVASGFLQLVFGAKGPTTDLIVGSRLDEARRIAANIAQATGTVAEGQAAPS